MSEWKIGYYTWDGEQWSHYGRRLGSKSQLLDTLREALELLERFCDHHEQPWAQARPVDTVLATSALLARCREEQEKPETTAEKRVDELHYTAQRLAERIDRLETRVFRKEASDAGV